LYGGLRPSIGVIVDVPPLLLKTRSLIMGMVVDAVVGDV
jgi:hypothetical protein